MACLFGTSQNENQGADDVENETGYSECTLFGGGRACGHPDAAKLQATNRLYVQHCVFRRRSDHARGL